MNKTKKKGFTIVELVIVIAVIAILAAVLIPTFSGLIKKANQSADIQAVRQMNTYLAVNEVGGQMDITDVYEALEEGGMTAKDYKALTTGHYFFWDSKLNRVLYTDGNDKVLFPEEYTDVKSSDDGHQWYSLNGKINGAQYTKTSENGTTTIAVASGAQMYQAIQDLQSKEMTLNSKGQKGNFQHVITTNTVIELKEDIDMLGASFDIGAVNTGVSLTINGNGHKISGVSTLENAVENAPLNAEKENRDYYCGLIKFVGDNANVTFNNIQFDNLVMGNMTTGSAGILVGNVRNNATITFDSVVITNSTLYGNNKLGALVGGLAGDTSNIVVKGETKLENVNIYSAGGEAGILFGSTSNSGASNDNVKIDAKLFGENGSIDFIKNCSVTCVSANVKDVTPGEGTGFNATLDGKSVCKIKEDGSLSEDYRVSTAFLGFDGTDKAYNATAKVVSNFNPINDYEQAIAAGWIYNFDNDKIVTA